MNGEHITGAILSVGDELTLGQTLDTNAKWLAQQLAGLGIVPVEHTTVPDDLDAQANALRRLAERADVILCSGGLGPTSDDLTRAALAKASGDELVEDPVSRGQIERWFSRRTRAMPEINLVQAQRPSRAIALENRNGTAPGLAGEIPRSGGGACSVFCLPGPPGELKPMFEVSVLPRLRPSSRRAVITRALHCFGIGESDLAARLGPLMDRSRNPLVGTTASGGVVSCRVRYEGPVEGAQAAVDATLRDVERAAEPFVFGSGDETLAGVVLELLQRHGARAGCVESCTGGLLGGMMTEVPGSSRAFVGGLITYSNAMKTRLAGVPAELLEPGGPGAVSREVARAMAVGGRERLECDHCMSITGIAGPDGGSDEKPVGLVWIGLASRDGTEPDIRCMQMAGTRQLIREWSARAALTMLRLRLCGIRGVKLLREVDR